MIRFWTSSYYYEKITLDFAKGILKAAKGVLADIRKHGKPILQWNGICANIEHKFSNDNPDTCVDLEVIHLVSICAVKWDYPANRRVGRLLIYPVEENENFGKWEGPNKEARLSLIRYVIKRLGDTIRRAEKNGKATIK